MENWGRASLVRELGLRYPLLQAPMAGVQTHELAVAVAKAGGLGAIPCASLNPEQIRSEVAAFRAKVKAPLNLNFFCHQAALYSESAEREWKELLAPYYLELGIDSSQDFPPSSRNPFDEQSLELLEELRPELVSFHFGLPSSAEIKRIKAIGCKIISSATTVAEARWLEARGADAIIAQGAEAGGHRAMFLNLDVSQQVGLMALLPQIVDAVSIPVIASGGLGDARSLLAAASLGATAVQLGSLFLLAHETKTTVLHRLAIKGMADDSTAMTNLFTGRPARGISNRLMREMGPMQAKAPAFPLAGGALAPLKKAAEQQGKGSFSSLWCGQAGAMAKEASAGEIIAQLMTDFERRRVAFL